MFTFLPHGCTMCIRLLNILAWFLRLPISGSPQNISRYSSVSRTRQLPSSSPADFGFHDDIMIVVGDHTCTPLESSHTHDTPTALLRPSDGDLKNTVRSKIIHYHRMHADLPVRIVFIPLVVNTTDSSRDYCPGQRTRSLISFDFFALSVWIISRGLSV
jgi:hypothetical protein